MKRGIAFSGGGSKGSYQAGVWSALNELGYEFDIATGTSIGSVNAGFYVQQDYDVCMEFWDTLQMDDVMVDGINLDGNIVSLAEEMASARPFLKRYLTHKGADVTPFINNLVKLADENKFFSSEIDYALITVKFSPLLPVEITKKDIAPGTLVEWITASCSCFPLFPVTVIDGQTYIDGGYYDNLPIASAFNLGAKEVFAVDLNSECCHPEYLNHPFVRYIYPSVNLGSFMSFEHEAMMKNKKIGYRDAYKFFRKLYGRNYSFEIKEEKKDYYGLLAYRFMSHLSVAETKVRRSGKVINKSAVSAKCTELLTNRLYYGKELTDYFIAAYEVCADFLYVDNGDIIDFDDFTEFLISIILESGFKFSSSDDEKIKEIKKLIKILNRRHRRELAASTEEILIMLSVFTTLCE